MMDSRRQGLASPIIKNTDPRSVYLPLLPQSAPPLPFLFQILPHPIMDAIPSFSNYPRPYLAHIALLL